MAFHRGAVRALDELGLLERVDVVSTVSGGSVFGAGWMCAIRDGRSTQSYVEGLEPVLKRGFVRPALLSLRILELLLPGRTRSTRIAQTFDEILTGRKALGELPQRPLLCMNTTVLNHGQVGRFSRGGFSCLDVGTRNASGGYPEVPVSVTVGFAAAASAAFPFGLPPLRLAKKALGPAALTGRLQGHGSLVLTDGGVLENLGVQTLMSSGRFGARHLIVSDAGTHEGAWQPSILGRLVNLGAFTLASDDLSRLVSVMNSKQNRSMRQLVTLQIGAVDPPSGDRLLLFVRIDQTWARFLCDIPQRRRRELAKGGAVPPQDAPPAHLESFLQGAGVDLGRARALYEEMGGDASASRVNEVGTNFTGLSGDVLRALRLHAEWQMHAANAIYGPLPAQTPISKRADAAE
jgi:NTE family protein